MRFLVSVLFCILVSTSLLASEESTAKVERGPLTVTVSSEGTVVPGETAPVSASSLAVKGPRVLVEVLEPGTVVGPGDVLMRFDARALERAVEDARFEMGVAKGEFERGQEKFRLEREAAHRSLEKAERELAAAERNYRGYVDHELAHKETRRGIDEEGHTYGIKNAKEELAQLERMYEEDELVDETENIVLERARRDVRRREASYALWKRMRTYSIEYGERNREKSLRLTLDGKRVALDIVRRSLAMAEAARKVNEQRARRSLARRAESLDELVGDLGSMTVRSPAAGVLLHGPEAGALGRRFKTGDQVKPAQPVATIALPGTYEARFGLPAAKVMSLRVGLSAVLSLAGSGANGRAGTLTALAALPQGDKLDARARPALAFARELLGQKVKVQVRLTEVEDALLVPVAGVLRSGGRAFCRLSPDGRLVPVEIGADDGKSAVVLKGLDEGAEILLPGEAE